MNDTIAGLLGFALMAALFVAYAWERRARRRGTTVAGSAEVAVDVVATPDVATMEPESAVRAQSRSSPNWGMPIVYGLLLAGADAHRGSLWGYLWQGLYFALIAVALYSTFSPKELAAEQVRRPDTTRTGHYLALGVPYVLVPALAWVLVIPLGWMGGIFVPAVPWVLLLVGGLLGVALPRR